jgi:hypothetical protein
MHDLTNARLQYKRQQEFNMVKEQIQQQLVGDCKALKMAGLAVGLALSRYFNRQAFMTDHTLVAYPGINRLMKDTSLSRRAVQRAIRRLEQRKHFRIFEGGGGRGKPHRYTGQVVEFQGRHSQLKGVTRVIRTSDSQYSTKKEELSGIEEERSISEQDV